MTKVAAIGGSEFVLGFQLAGIRNTIETNENPMLQIKDLMKEEETSIVIIDQKTLDMLDEHNKEDIESSIDPVFIPLSTEVSQDGLKKLIKKSIGVDLWK
jgi:vacuolar-type H+-ATPase subunit F/Vma7